VLLLTAWLTPAQLKSSSSSKCKPLLQQHTTMPLLKSALADYCQQLHAACSSQQLVAVTARVVVPPARRDVFFATTESGRNSNANLTVRSRLKGLETKHKHCKYTCEESIWRCAVAEGGPDQSNTYRHPNGGPNPPVTQGFVTCIWFAVRCRCLVAVCLSAAVAITEG
jgi:hypothetical protein